jgi:hypothetical protein
VQHIAGWYTSCGMFFPEGSGPTKRDRLGPAQLLNNLSLTPQQNPGGMVYPPTPPIPLPFCEGNPYPCQGVGVLEGKGKGKDLIPWGYPCHSLVRSQNQVALCVASSGIASLLLEGGRTAHSTFKIPIPITDTSTAGVKKNTHMHDVLKQTKAIIWDEVPMQHKHAVASVDRLLRDLLKQTSLLEELLSCLEVTFVRLSLLCPEHCARRLLVLLLPEVFYGTIWKSIL